MTNQIAENVIKRTYMTSPSVCSQAMATIEVGIFSALSDFDAVSNIPEALGGNKRVSGYFVVRV